MKLPKTNKIKLPQFRVHQCGSPDTEIRPIVSTGNYKILPIYVKDKCGGETIVEIHVNNYVNIRVFHTCTNHITDRNTPTAQCVNVFPHEEELLKRLGKDG